MGQVLHFGDPAAECRAALAQSVLVDRSDLGRLLAVGPDILSLLHRLGTADLAGLAPGQGRPTVLTTPKGRIVERLFVHHLGAEGVLLVGGSGSATRVAEHLARCTFRENTGLSAITEAWFQLAITGPRAAAALAASGIPAPDAFASCPSSVAGTPVHVLGEDGLSDGGFSIVGAAGTATAVWDALEAAVRAAGGRPAGTEALSTYRVLHGIPAAGLELTEEHNPLEAGLWNAVSFSKGCYVGQEVIARLRTYDKVARALMGLEWPAAAEPPPGGARLYREGREVGRLTSVVRPAGSKRTIALAYVKRREVQPGFEVRLGASEDGVVARLVELPFPLTL